MTTPQLNNAISKVPAITIGFWCIKILATTLGETAGDTLSMSFNFGYLVATVIFLLIFLFLALFQIRAKAFTPLLYWATIIASTTAGTTLADFATRSLGIGYLGGSILLGTLVLAALFVWKRTLGAINADDITDYRTEIFYWLTITFSQTLGTALGDWTADSGGMGYLGAAGLFAVALLLVAGAYFWTQFDRVILFWAAFILTRPLGAAVGDFLDKPIDDGGLALSRAIASLVLLGAIALLLILLPQRAGQHGPDGDLTR